MLQTVRKGKKAQAKWEKLFKQYAQAYPELAKQFEDWAAGKININLDENLPKFEAGSPLATRQASGKVLNALMPKLPFILGGSADLTPSNNTRFDGAKDFQRDCPEGRYIRFGVREHAMGAIVNGISVSGLLRAYGATFLSIQRLYEGSDKDGRPFEISVDFCFHARQHRH